MPEPGSYTNKDFRCACGKRAAIRIFVVNRGVSGATDENTLICPCHDHMAETVTAYLYRRCQNDSFAPAPRVQYVGD